MAKKKETRRQFHGVTFVCHRPGEWISDCGHYGIYCMMAGLACEQWEAYVVEDLNSEPIDGDYIASALTMNELVRDIHDELKNHTH